MQKVEKCVRVMGKIGTMNEKMTKNNELYPFHREEWNPKMDFKGKIVGMRYLKSSLLEIHQKKCSSMVPAPQNYVPTLDPMEKR